MNIDIRLSLDFFEHPKTKKLLRRLGSDGVICLQKIWMWTAGHYPKGTLENVDAEDIELIADWQGDPGELVRTLTELAWLDKTDAGYAMHNWEERQAYACRSDERHEAAKKAINARWGKNRENTQGIRTKYASNTGRIRTEYDQNTEPIRMPYGTDTDAIPQTTKTPIHQNTNTPIKERAATADAVASAHGEQYIEFVKDFQESIAREQGSIAPKVTDSLINAGAAEIDKCVRIDGLDYDELRRALEWARNDSFWAGNVRSLAQIRKKNRNGTSKAQNIVEQYRRGSVQKIPKQPQYESRYEREQREKRESYAETMRILNMMDGKDDGQERADFIDASAFGSKLRREA